MASCSNLDYLGTLYGTIMIKIVRSSGKKHLHIIWKLFVTRISLTWYQIKIPRLRILYIQNWQGLLVFKGTYTYAWADWNSVWQMILFLDRKYSAWVTRTCHQHFLCAKSQKSNIAFVWQIKPVFVYKYIFHCNIMWYIFCQLFLAFDMFLGQYYVFGFF
jgi:hypothetical protein